MKAYKIIRNRIVKPLASTIKLAILTVVMTIPGIIIAGPTEGVVVSGAGQITQPNALTTNINQSSQNLIANWKTFNIGAGESVNFIQPNASATALNQIFDQNPSQIFGSLNSNGRVFLVNPNGLYFSKTAKVNVGSLVATTLKIDKQKFMSGQNILGDLDIPVEGAIVNQGLLQAATGGSISLIANEVRNEGIIIAKLGHINLASGRKAILDFDGDGLINFEIQGNIEQNTTQAENAVFNSGEIIANGGQVLLTAVAAKDVFTNVINTEGVIRANRIESQDGEVHLVGTGNIVVGVGGIIETSVTEIIGLDIVLDNNINTGSDNFSTTGGVILTTNGSDITLSGDETSSSEEDNLNSVSIIGNVDLNSSIIPATEITLSTDRLKTVEITKQFERSRHLNRHKKGQTKINPAVLVQNKPIFSIQGSGLRLPGDYTQK